MWPLAPLFYLIIEVTRFIAVSVSLSQVFRVRHRGCRSSHRPDIARSRSADRGWIGVFTRSLKPDWARVVMFKVLVYGIFSYVIKLSNKA
jgi:hypothetical protein